MSKPGALKKIEGYAWLILLASLAWFVLSGPINRYSDASIQISDAQNLLSDYERRLETPRTMSEHLKYRSFIHPSEAETILESGDIQSALISIAKKNRTRLIDLRVLENNTSIETLLAQRFRLDVEGDLIAVLDVAKNIATIGQPALIDAITIAPVGNQDRPDRRLKASFELSFWKEGV